MNRIPSIFLACMALTQILSPGCTVKEDREECPAQLCLLLPPASEENAGAYVTLTGPDGYGNTLLTPLGKDTTLSATFPVTRERFLLTVATEPFYNGRYEIPPGAECPYLYIYRAYVCIPGEYAKIETSWRKEFCTLTLNLIPAGTALKMQIRGSWCGIEDDSSLKRGSFSCNVPPDGNIRIPRQGDTSLILDIIASGDTVVRSFALGEYLAASGYDWTAHPLEDVSIDIDYARSTIILKSTLWDYSFPIELSL